MPRFYSAEWIDAFNSAVADLAIDHSTSASTVVADRGSFRAAQQVSDAPSEIANADGSCQVELLLEGGRLTMSRTDPTASLDSAPDVTVILSYTDAASLSRGELQPADALGEGRIRVRGDLAVLLAGKDLLVAASAHLHDLRESTEY